MNKLARHTKSVTWGEDPHTALALARNTGSSALAEQSEKLVLRQYRLRLREEFEKNSDVMALLEASKPAQKAAPKLVNLLSKFIREESSDLFHQVLDELLQELEEQRQNPASLYLVDTDTGKTLMPINERHIYQPPDFIGEDGQQHKARPVVHPGVSAPIILSRNQNERKSQALAKAGPHAQAAFEHLKDPDSIRARAIEALAAEGIGLKFNDVDDSVPTKTVVIEFGREQLDGIMQSGNLRFHRAHAFAQILARRVISELHGCRICQLGPVELKTNAKKRWYVCEIQIPTG